MLNIFRKNTKIIIWTVVLSFALWGAFSVGTSFQKEGRYAGEVFGKPVTFQEFNRFYRGVRLFTPPEELAENPDLLRQKTWQNIIYSRAAKKRGIKVSDDEVRKELRRILSAQNLPQITPEYYKRWLKATVRMDASAFESQLREMIRIRKLFSVLADAQPAAPLTEEELEKAYEAQNRRIDAGLLLVDTPEKARDLSSRLEDAGKRQAIIEEAGLEALPVEGSLAEIVETWKILPQYAEVLFNLPEGAVSQPVPVQDSWGIFLMNRKTDASFESLDEEARKEFRQQLQERKKQLSLASRHYRILLDANLEDYTEPAQPQDSAENQ